MSSASEGTPPSTERTGEDDARRAARRLATGRILAFVGAALFALAAWLPWVVVGVDADGTRQGLLLDPGRIGAPPLAIFLDLSTAFAVWSAISTLGVPLAALLWLGGRGWGARLIWPSYGAWLLLVSYTAAQSALSLLRPGEYHLALAPGVSEVAVTVHRTDLGVGLAVALVALLLCWAGGALVIVGGMRAFPNARSAAPAGDGARWPRNVWVLTVGLIGWALGFLQMAWAVVDCDAPLLFGGTCVGLGATGALHYALGASVTLPVFWSASGLVIGLDPLAARYAIPTLLLGGALPLALGLWRRPTARALSGWLALWLFVAAGFTLLALLGVQLVMADAPGLGQRPGRWEGALGIYATLLSLVCVLVGLGMREAGMQLRRWRSV